jgi:two-component sensor histidine kinase
VDGGALLGQLLTEQCDDLCREGFIIQPPVFDRKFTLCLRTEDAVRVFDNLYSNFRKYADPASPIEITWKDASERITLRFRSRVLSSPDRADSHGLGVPTMRELLERSGGTLEARQEDGVYQTILTFPKHREPR